MAKRPLLRRARLEAKLRYGPEIRALQELAAESRGTFRSGVRAEKGAAEGIRAAVREAKPKLAGSYDKALGTAGVAAQDVDRAVAPLGASADPFKAVIARERGGAVQRLSEARTDALRELSERGVDAEAGRAYAVSNLRGQHRQDMEKIGRQRQGLESEIGEFTRATFGELKDAQAKLDLENQKLELQLADDRRAQRKLDSDITGIDPKTGKPTAAERQRRRQARKEGRGDGLTPTQQRTYQDKFGKAVAGILPHVASGRFVGTWEDADGKKHRWTEQTAMESLLGDDVPAPLARAAIQRALHGYVFRPDARKIKQRYGVKAKSGRPLTPIGPGGIPIINGRATP